MKREKGNEERERREKKSKRVGGFFFFFFNTIFGAGNFSGLAGENISVGKF